METLLEKSLEHAPALAAMVAIVWFFLAFLTKLLAQHSQRTSEFIDTLKEIQLQNLEARNDSRAVIERNTTTQVNAATENMRNTEAIRDMTRALKDVKCLYKS